MATTITTMKMTLKVMSRLSSTIVIALAARRREEEED
jgi:hypothetical protein